MARLHPLAEVIVLEPNPFARLAPQNCHFEKGDIETYAPIDEEGPKFDYIFLRNVRFVSDWPKLLLHLKSLLDPDGLLELMDVQTRGYTLCTCETPMQWHANPECRKCLVFPKSDDRRKLVEMAGFPEIVTHSPNRPVKNRDGRDIFW